MWRHGSHRHRANVTTATVTPAAFRATPSVDAARCTRWQEKCLAVDALLFSRSASRCGRSRRQRGLTSPRRYVDAPRDQPRAQHCRARTVQAVQQRHVSAPRVRDHDRDELPDVTPPAGQAHELALGERGVPSAPTSAQNASECFRRDDRRTPADHTRGNPLDRAERWAPGVGVSRSQQRAAGRDHGAARPLRHSAGALHVPLIVCALAIIWPMTMCERHITTLALPHLSCARFAVIGPARSKPAATRDPPRGAEPPLRCVPGRGGSGGDAA